MENGQSENQQMNSEIIREGEWKGSVLDGQRIVFGWQCQMVNKDEWRENMTLEEDEEMKAVMTSVTEDGQSDGE